MDRINTGSRKFYSFGRTCLHKWKIFIWWRIIVTDEMKICQVVDRCVVDGECFWMTLQTSQWSQILQIKFCRKQSAYVVLSNDKYAGNFHNANCLHIIHKGTLSKLNCKCPFFFLFIDCQSQHHSSWFAHLWREEQGGKVQGEDCIKEELENVYDSQKCNIWMKDFKIWNKTIAEKV